jgi:hypothetical protein
LKRKILAFILGIAIVSIGCFQVIPAFAQTTGTLDHVVITPNNVTLAAGSSLQFSAQAFDQNNQQLTGVICYWMVTSGGGVINNSGLFTAGHIPGTYTNTVMVFAVQGNNARVATASVTVTAPAPGTFHHVKITPPLATLLPGGTQQFTAQAFDISNTALSGFTYSWSVVNGGGSIDLNGVFTAGTATGNFKGTVQVNVINNGSIVGTGRATVIVREKLAVTPCPFIDRNKLAMMFGCFLRNHNFSDFLGGQWQVKDGDTIKTINVIPGIVQAQTAASATSITIVPNGKTDNVTYSITSDTLIRPKDARFNAGDKVIIVTVNGGVVLVMKVAPADAGRLPPGLGKQGEDRREGKFSPPGWLKGLKNGWEKLFKGNKAHTVK